MKEIYGFYSSDAWTLLNQYVKSERMLSHCYAAEAVMGALARRLGQDEELWKIAGLLHDLDIEIVDNDLDRHGLETEKILKEKVSMPVSSTPLLCIMKKQAERSETVCFSTRWQHRRRLPD